MKALDNLEQDHLAIERVLDLFEEAGNRVRTGQPVPAGFERWAVETLCHFGDHCHHVKEETALFPLLRVRGMLSEAGPLDVIFAEHERGRTYLRRMMDDAMRRDHVGFALVAEEYARWLRRHMFKENYVIFQMAENFLTDGDDFLLMDNFHAIEQEFGGEQIHERFEAEIKQWEEKFREPVKQCGS
jgi:hemerythrin-like domain-containing protein